MRIILKGGPADGREVDLPDAALRIAVPMFPGRGWFIYDRDGSYLYPEVDVA